MPVRKSPLQYENAVHQTGASKTCFQLSLARKSDIIPTKCRQTRTHKIKSLDSGRGISLSLGARAASRAWVHDSRLTDDINTRATPLWLAGVKQTSTETRVHRYRIRRYSLQVRWLRFPYWRTIITRSRLLFFRWRKASAYDRGKLVAFHCHKIFIHSKTPISFDSKTSLC